jgi:hypothetical protein
VSELVQAVIINAIFVCALTSVTFGGVSPLCGEQVTVGGVPPVIVHENGVDAELPAVLVAVTNRVLTELTGGTPVNRPVELKDAQAGRPLCWVQVSTLGVPVPAN